MPGEGELSINDSLYPGPNLIPKLLDVLVQFRNHPVVLSADIEKAFLINVHEGDRDMLRFLWFEEPPNPNSEVIHLRFTRLVFGLRPSPAILNSMIREHLNKYKDVYPTIVQHVRDSLYVEDLVSGTEDLDKGFEVYKAAKRVMAEGNIQRQQLVRRMRLTDTKTVKLLGVSWNCESNDRCFNISDLINFAKDLPITKRSLLKLTAKIFDPLGMLSPFVVKMKYLFQVICQVKKDWDEPVHGDLLKEWNTIVNELPLLNAVRISRCYYLLHIRPVKTELHAFSDAPNKAYAAVIYLRSTYEIGQILIRFVAAKTRIAPVKAQTIPRLELLGAVILARLVSTVVKSLPSDIPITYWVDSTTILHWIKNERAWKQYVNHRVSEIRQLTSKTDWRFCPGHENPADLATQGLSAEEFLNNSLWWEGPGFLARPKEEWPNCPVSASGEELAALELVKHPPQVCHSKLHQKMFQRLLTVVRSAA